MFVLSDAVGVYLVLKLSYDKLLSQIIFVSMTKV